MPARTDADRKEAGHRAAQVLAEGGLVVYPTETVYGIGGDGSERTNRLVNRVKRRPMDQPLLLLIPDVEVLQASLPGVRWEREAEAMARHFWPGPLTIVVSCTGAPPGLVGRGDGLAVRVSPHPVVVEILREWRRPITSTSANLSGANPPRSFAEALRPFGGRPDLEDLNVPVLGIDGGSCGEQPPSTIVSLIETPPRVLRRGPIGTEELAEVIPEVVEE